MSLKRVVAALKRNNRFLITTHTNVEGDALGSELAFYRLLEAIGKRASIVNEDSVPEAYRFLPGADKIIRFKNHSPAIPFDCFVILDASSMSRCGRVAKLNAGNKPVINIDHHVSNEIFGRFNWVEPRASSASEMVYKLYKAMRVPFERETALLLYVGMLTDTGSFHYANTSSFTHRAAAELLQFGLNVPQVYQKVYENIPFKDMQLLGRILPTMRLGARGRIAWLMVPAEAARKAGAGFDLSEALLKFARAVEGVEVAVLFRENLHTKNEVRVNFRSQGKVDVNRIAGYFHGGGHRTASGCTISGTIANVRRKVLNKIKGSL